MATPRKKKKPASPALAKRAAQLADKKVRELRALGADLVAVIHEKRETIAGAFYEIGCALKRLSDPAMVRAMGHASFEALLKTELGMSLSYAERLVAISEHVREPDAIRWGEQKSAVVAELKKIEGVRQLPGGRLRLPTGAVVDADVEPPTRLAQTAKTLRQSRPRPTHRGRTTTAAERNLAADLQRALRAAKVRTAKVTAIATKPGAPSDLSLRLPASALSALAKVLRPYV